MTLQLALLPFRGTDAHVMGVLADKLAEKGFACNLLPETAVPADALDRLRGQYRAKRLLDATKRAAAGRVLGVADVDLYAEGLNFVFGMAESPGWAAVISVTRLRLGADEAAFEERMLKEAVHELGHTPTSFQSRSSNRSSCAGLPWGWWSTLGGSGQGSGGSIGSDSGGAETIPSRRAMTCRMRSKNSCTAGRLCASMSR